MLRGLLRDSQAVRALFEKFHLFKAPEQLEKYVIASEVTVEVLDLFVSRVFGTERSSIGCGSGDLAMLWESLDCLSLGDHKGSAGEHLSTRADETDKEMEGLRVKVQDLERQLGAVQRQLQIQATAFGDRVDEIVRQCEERVFGVRSQVAAAADDVGNIRELSEEVSRLKESERRLRARVSDAEEKTTEI